MNQRKRASFTVEASLIFPFACFLLAVFLQGILYLHDTSVFAAAAYETAQKCAELKNTGQKEMEAYGMEAAGQILEKKRLACSEYRVKVQVSKTKVQVRIEGSTHFLQGQSFYTEKEVLRINPIVYLRNVKKLKGIKG